MRRLTSILISATMVAGLLTTVGASSASACGAAVAKRDVFRAMRDGRSLDAGVVSVNSLEQVSLLTFNLDVKKLKPVYSIGDVVSVDVTVTRPAKEDPLGNGIPMERPYVEPAEGVFVGVGLHVGRVFLPGAAISDDNGLARVRIKLEDYAPAGARVDLSIYAWKVLYDAPCASVQEYGYMTAPGAFKTAR